MNKLTIILLLAALLLGGCDLFKTGTVSPDIGLVDGSLVLEDIDSREEVAGFYAITRCGSPNPTGEIELGTKEIIRTTFNQTCDFYGWSDTYYTGQRQTGTLMSNGTKHEVRMTKMGNLAFTSTVEELETREGSTFKEYLITVNVTSQGGYFRKANVCYDWTPGILSVDSLFNSKQCASAKGWETTDYGGIYFCEIATDIYETTSGCNALSEDNKTCYLGLTPPPQRLKQNRECELIEDTITREETVSYEFKIVTILLNPTDEVTFTFYDANRQASEQSGIPWTPVREDSYGKDVGAPDYSYTVKLGEVLA